MNTKIRNVDVEGVGNLPRFTTNFNLTNDLFEHALLLAYADGFANQVQGNGNLDFLSLHQPGEISVYQAPTNWIDLPVIKHDFTGPEAFDVERENRVTSRLRPQNCCQFAKRRQCGHT